MDNTRNLSDRELEAIQHSGGVVQVTAFSADLSSPAKDFAARLAELSKRFGLPEATAPDAGIQNLARAEKIGIDHVGIGSDFNHGAGVIGFQNEGDAGNVTRELVRRHPSFSVVRSSTRGSSTSRTVARCRIERERRSIRLGLPATHPIGDRPFVPFFHRRPSLRVNSRAVGRYLSGPGPCAGQAPYQLPRESAMSISGFESARSRLSQ